MIYQFTLYFLGFRAGHVPATFIVADDGITRIVADNGFTPILAR